MRARAVTALGVLTLLAAPAAAQAASPLQHFDLSFDEDPVVSVVGGLGPACAGLAGTLTES
jgi:hypothetical protein